jgi:hypothetical protein
MKPIALALCLAAAMAVPGASARNAEDYWCGTPRIHLMMWIAKVQVWARDDEGKLTSILSACRRKARDHPCRVQQV